MPIMLGLWKFLKRAPDTLYPFESRVIEEVKARLSEEAKDRLQRQFSTMKRIQRLTCGKEVNFYAARRGKPVFDKAVRFPDSGGEVLLATVTLAHPKNRTRIKA